ncbi:hypothetical protein V6Z11_1Z098200 [Gossypium hirsutum]
MSSKCIDIAYIVQEGNSPYILINLEEIERQLEISIQ